jgi:hypothetical protein
MKIFGFAVNSIAGLVAVGAGIFLLAHQNESGDTWLEVLAHGVGIYFIARGLYMIGSSITSAAADQ